MAVTFLAAMRSKDPCTKVRACIVNKDKKIVGVGYNGMPNGCNDDKFTWKRPDKISLWSGPRSDYLDWDDYFMAVTFLAAMRSKDPCTQVGACIVNKDKKIVGVGYNGMPNGCNDDEFPWTRPDKYTYVCHAGLNAILNKNAESVKNCTMYVGLFPCNECAKLIIQSGITEVCYMSDKDRHRREIEAARRMFRAAKVDVRHHLPKRGTITIDFANMIDMMEE